ncbi:MAG: hypothetical protein RLZZ597_1608 [Cyanobacteriota bacterium]|jgi:PAS domain S-box-containing protein
MNQRHQPHNQLSCNQASSDQPSWDQTVLPAADKPDRILENAMVAISSFFIDGDGNWEYDYWSAGCERLFGYSLDHYRDKTFWLSQVYPDDREQQIQPLFEDFYAERDATAEYRFRHGDGTLRWFSSTYTSIKVAEGRWMITAVNHDITDRKQAALVLRQQIQQEYLLNDITQAICHSLNLEVVLASIVERSRTVLETDRVVVFRLLSHGEGCVVAEAVAEGINPLLDTTIHDPCLGDFYAESYRWGWVGMVQDVDHDDLEPCHRAMLRRFQVRANIVVPILHGEIGQGSVDTTEWGSEVEIAGLWGLLIVHQCRAPRQWQPAEVALLKRVAAKTSVAVQQSDLYQKICEQATLLDIASDAIFVRDLNHRITYWNRGAERLYGWSAAEALGQVCQTLMHGDLPYLDGIMQTLLTEGEWKGEITEETKTGQRVTVAARWTLVRDKAQQPTSILSVETDITEQKKLQAQFFQAQRLESLGRLASGIAHDLNNMLTPILTMTQMLQDSDALGPAAQESLRLIEESARRGSSMVQQILTVNSHRDDIKAPVDVVVLLQNLTKVLRSSLPKTITITLDLPPVLAPVQADATNLYQVFMNLCINARDAMPSGGTLTLTAEPITLDATTVGIHIAAKVGDYLRLTVADTGLGIAPSVRDRIFDPFFTTKEVGQGTGLGLATVRAIVKDLGGFVLVDSNVGQGTQIQVYLPVMMAAAQATAKTTLLVKDYPAPQPGQGQLVLVVDDDPTVQQTTQALLESQHYSTIAANNGQEAIQQYAQHRHAIQLVILDMMMPTMDGPTLIQRLQTLDPAVKTLGISGLPTYRTIALAAGASAFLAKPYDLDDLLGAVTALIQSQT